MHATVRNFRAPDVASALSAVKDALGPEAVILSTREIPGGLLRRPEVEVTAAWSPEPSAPAPAPVPLPVRARVPARPEPSGPAVAELSAELDELRRELNAARREMKVVCLRSGAERELALGPAAADVYGQLVQRGVEEPLAEELVRQAVLDGARSDALLAAVRELVGRRLLPGSAPWLPGRGRRVLALVGPTGVGKTTTLAKIAARALLDHRSKVALITVDTYRVGASEQLARYGQVMKIPAHVARDAAELERAMRTAAGADLVLVDTSGRAVSEAVARQAEMLRKIPGIELGLVVSAAAGWREMSATAERYRRLAPERLIFSKVDEAAAPGGVLSVAVRLGRSVSCISDGQRVPEDLHAATREDLGALVVGEQATARAAQRSE